MNIYKGYKGKVPIPPSSGDYALLSDNGTIKWGVAGGGGTGTFTDYEDKIFVAKHGNNSNDGLNIESAVLTISQAVSLANSLISGGSSKVAIKVADGGTYTEGNIVLDDNISLYAEQAFINGRITIRDAATVKVNTIIAENNGFPCIQKNAGGVNSFVEFNQIDTSNVATTKSRLIRNDGGGILYVKGSRVDVPVDSTLLGDETSGFGHIHLELEDLYLAGNNAVGIKANQGSDSIIARIDHILKIGSPTGTKAIESTSATGRTFVRVSEITENIDVQDGNLYIDCNQFSGTLSHTGGNIQGFLGNRLFGFEDITSIVDADFTSFEYDLTSDKLSGLSNYLLRVDSVSDTTHYINLPTGTPEINGLGTQINFNSGNGLLIVRDSLSNTVQEFKHSNDTITIIWDNTASEWVITQTTIASTGDIDVDPFTSDVSDILVLEDWLKLSDSTTELSGGAITVNGDGSIDVASSQWLIRNADSSNATLRPIKIPAALGVTLTDEATNFLIVDYNAGTPQYDVVPDITAVDCTDRCVKSVLFRNGTQVDTISLARYGVDFKAKYMRKQAVTNWLEYGSGLQPSFTGLEFSISGGVLYNGVYQYTIQPLSSAVDTFEYWYRDGTGGWTVTTGNTEINNTQYDDGTGTLATFSTPQRGGVHWIYVSVDDPSRLLVVFGQEEYDDIASARAAQVPSALPPFAEKYSTGKLVGKAIVQRDGTSLIDLESPFSTVFTGSTPVQHNNLSGLQGGTAGEYYHLTEAQHTIATQPASSTDEGYVTTDSQTFEGGKRFNDIVAINQSLTSGWGLRIGNSGLVYSLAIDGSAPSSAFYVTGAGRVSMLDTFSATTGSASNVFMASNGTLSRSTSSIKYKTNVEDLWSSYSADFLSKSRPIWYDSLSDNDNKDWHWLGFIAEELHEDGFHQLVHYKENEDGTLEPEGVQYDRITVILTKELQKAKAEREELKKTVEALLKEVREINTALGMENEHIGDE